MVLDIEGVLGLSTKKNGHENKKDLFNLSLKMRILHQKGKFVKRKKDFHDKVNP